jgi:hypothetical protein
MLERSAQNGVAQVEFLLANRAKVLAESEESVLYQIEELMREQLVAGEKLLGFELGWDAHYRCILAEDAAFIHTDDEFAQSPELTFWVQADGKLSGGESILAELRRAIIQAFDDHLATMREELDIVKR